MSKPNLAAIRARVEAATEGPWDWASAPAEGSNETAAEYLEKALTDDGPLFVVWVPATQGASEGYRLTASTGDGPHASVDAEFIANARQDIPALLALIDELERWKVEALEVMAGLQELGQALGLPLGVKVTGTQAVDRAKELAARIERVRRVCRTRAQVITVDIVREALGGD